MNQEKMGKFIKKLREENNYTQKDIGDKLGCGAVMSALERICVGDFDISSSCKLDDVSENDVINVENVLSEFDCIYLYNDEAKKYENGIRFSKKIADGKYKIYLNDVFYGIAKIDKGILKSEKKI